MRRDDLAAAKKKMTAPADPSPAESWFKANVLWPGEKIVWSGRPGILRSMLFNSWFCIVGAFLTALLAVFWWTSDGLHDVRLPEILVVLGSLWLFLSPLRYGWRAWRTAYFVTDKRALILRKGLFRIHETAFLKGDITDFQLKRFAKDRGDIRLRLSQGKAPDPYQDDKQKYLRGASSWYGAGPFTQYNDGFWGADKISVAAAAIRKLT